MQSRVRSHAYITRVGWLWYAVCSVFVRCTPHNSNSQLLISTNYSKMTQKCSRCSYTGPISSFPLKKNGTGNLKTCEACTSKTDALNASAGERRKSAKAAVSANKENLDPRAKAASDNAAPKQGTISATTGRLEEMSLTEVMHFISAHKKDAIKLDCMAVIDDDTEDEMEAGI